MRVSACYHRVAVQLEITLSTICQHDIPDRRDPSKLPLWTYMLLGKNKSTPPPPPPFWGGSGNRESYHVRITEKSNQTHVYLFRVKDYDTVNCHAWGVLTMTILVYSKFKPVGLAVWTKRHSNTNLDNIRFTVLMNHFCTSARIYQLFSIYWVNKGTILVMIIHRTDTGHKFSLSTSQF